MDINDSKAAIACASFGRRALCSKRVGNW